MFRITQKASIKYLECFADKELDFMIHAFCTRQGGVSGGSFAGLNVSTREGDDNDHVRLNFESIAAAFGITVSQFLQVHQVHRDGVWVLDGRVPLPADDLPPECDAVVTDRPEVALCIKTADCVPVFLVDPVRRVIGAVHAGWKGTALQIVGKAVGKMVQRFGTHPSDLFAAIGPAIGPCCYEVDTTVYQAMSNHPERESFFQAGREKGKWSLDLFLANRLQLIQSGVPAQRIRQADFCTACHPGLFFSYRAQGGNTGRQLNFIMMR
ncbi:MAG: peptidoglycan editing factor PgeF [Pseudomonadota bacterium]